MAYMNQEKKSKIAALLKKVVPADWKYSLRVHHHSELILTIASAPIDLVAIYTGDKDHRGYTEVNHYHMEKHMDEAGVPVDLQKVFVKILEAMNCDNYDNSDMMSDYVSVGHYLSIKIGSWDKAFVVTEKKAK